MFFFSSVLLTQRAIEGYYCQVRNKVLFNGVTFFCCDEVFSPLFIKVLEVSWLYGMWRAHVRTKIEIINTFLDFRKIYDLSERTSPQILLVIIEWNILNT